MAWKKQYTQRPPGESGEFIDFQRMTHADMVNYAVMQCLRANDTPTFELATDKLEALLMVDMDTEKYNAELAPHKNQPNYGWAKFRLLLTKVREKKPLELEGQL